jgi:hypothetical protein
VVTGRGVFGFSVQSGLPLTFVRPGTSADVLTVDDAPSESMARDDRPIHEWRFSDPTGDVMGRLHNAGALYHVWFADAGWFRVDPVARRITAPREAEPVIRELRMWGIPTTLCSVERGDASLHAAAVDIGGSAVLLAAPGQHGKTTLALAFHACGHRVLSEDVACCRLDATPRLCPGPASLRVRPDMFGGSAPDGSTVVAERPDRIVLRIDDVRAGSADPVPIRAILFLRQTDNDIRFEPVDRVRALPDLYALSFRTGGRESAAETFARVSRLAAGTTIWNLYRPLRLDNLDQVVAEVAAAPFLRDSR